MYRHKGQTLWDNSLKKDMIKAEISYNEVGGCNPEEVRRGEVGEFKGFQDIICHIVFDVKMYLLARQDMLQMGT